MKRSSQVRLLLTTSLLAPFSACTVERAMPPPPPPGSGLVAGGADGVTFDPYGQYADNTYVAGLGYYHAASAWWYPYPVNYYVPSFGYYYGGLWYHSPHVVVIHLSRPDASRSYAWFQSRSDVRSTSRFSGGSYPETRASSPAPSTFSPKATGGITRGGFGMSGSASS